MAWSCHTELGLGKSGFDSWLCHKLPASLPSRLSHSSSIKWGYFPVSREGCEHKFLNVCEVLTCCQAIKYIDKPSDSSIYPTIAVRNGAL